MVLWRRPCQIGGWPAGRPRRRADSTTITARTSRSGHGHDDVWRPAAIAVVLPTPPAPVPAHRRPAAQPPRSEPPARSPQSSPLPPQLLPSPPPPSSSPPSSSPPTRPTRARPIPVAGSRGHR
ncbi:unnamed protein product [Macrosiphum euphorbiae]|uniref:Uncharacterized protein n=1 Tax=Macrosiphum euphorbiae TaxID=13131 RepID=A0AAV0XCD7_9HEMI|nr:unnamed protein product [Macrosiphum euphorbiae]